MKVDTTSVFFDLWLYFENPPDREVDEGIDNQQISNSIICSKH